jgi:Rod binding domain-containing protein
MDNAKLILTQAVPPPLPLTQQGKVGNIPDDKKEQTAKDFESLIIDKLLNEMKNTVGDWGFEKDGISEQIQGIFWLYLARDIANNGGFGMWKDVYRSLTSASRQNTAAGYTDNNI